jgi:hypothetical protein
MEQVLVIKLIVLSALWLGISPIYMMHTGRELNSKNTSIVLMPAILWFVWFLFFWWG